MEPEVRNPRQEHAFVVRMWREGGAPPNTWRGSIEHVGTQRRQYFADLSEVLDFIRRHT
jgi:hypothetical protein